MHAVAGCSSAAGVQHMQAHTRTSTRMHTNLIQAQLLLSTSLFFIFCPLFLCLLLADGAELRHSKDELALPSFSLTFLLFPQTHTHTPSRVQETGQSLYCRGDSSQHHWERNIDFLTGYFWPLKCRNSLFFFLNTGAFKGTMYILCVRACVCVDNKT